jgi:hypothetical protein
MVFNTTFNKISGISWWSVLLVEESGLPRENHRPVASHITLYRLHLAWARMYIVFCDYFKIFFGSTVLLCMLSYKWLSWSYGNWNSNYLYNLCLLPLMLWVRTPLRRGVVDTTLLHRCLNSLHSIKRIEVVTLKSAVYGV